VRIEFNASFFAAMGWDVRNVQGHSEQYKNIGGLGIVERQWDILVRSQEGKVWPII